MNSIVNVNLFFDYFKCFKNAERTEILLLFNLPSDFTFSFSGLNELLSFPLCLGVAITIFSEPILFIATNHILRRSIQFSMSFAFIHLFLTFKNWKEII